MRLTVATWNLYLGADLALLLDATTLEELADRIDVVRGQLQRTDFTERARAIAGLLQRERVDVVGLQEVSRWTEAPLSDLEHPTVLADFLPVLLAELEHLGTPYDVHAVESSFEGGLPVGDRWMQVTGSNAVLARRDARLEITAEETEHFATTLELRTGVEGVAFPVRRSWGRVDLVAGGRRLTLVNTHTEAYDAGVRDAQRDELLAQVEAQVGQGDAVVLVGDLNATPEQVGVAAPYVDAWTAAGGDAAGGRTCGQSGDLSNPEPDLRVRIDYVFVRNLVVRSCRVVGGDPQDRTPSGLWPSDHAAVVAELEL